MTETKRLGRGLEALLGPVSREQAEASGALRELPLSSVKPNPVSAPHPDRPDGAARLGELDGGVRPAAADHRATPRQRLRAHRRRAAVARGPAARLGQDSRRS